MSNSIETQDSDSKPYRLIAKSIVYQTLQALRDNKQGYGLSLGGLTLSLIVLAVSLSSTYITSDGYLERDLFVALLVFGICLTVSGVNTIIKPKNFSSAYGLILGTFYFVVVSIFLGKYFFSNLMYPLSIQIFSACLSGAILVALFALFKKSQTVQIREEKPVPFSALRDNLESTISNSENATLKLRLFKKEMEAYGAENWEKEQELEEKYFNTVMEVFQLLDHFDSLFKKDRKSKEITWLYERTSQILSHRGISEIPVNRGDVFDARYHKGIGKLTDSIPRGRISEVTRRGYFIKGLGNEDAVVLREAEVVVCDRQSEVTVNKTSGGE